MELELKRIHISDFQTAADTTLCQEETLEAIVPDACPDILRIVEVYGQACLTGKQAGEGYAAAAGTVKVSVLYVPEGEGPLCRVELRMPFECRTEARGLTARGMVQASPRLRWAEARALNPRKLLLRGEVAVDLAAYEPRQISVCQGGHAPEEAGLRQLVEEKSAHQIAAAEEKPFSFSEQLRLSGGAGETLSARACAVCTEAKLIGSKLIFKGNVELNLLLRGQEGGLEASRHTLPFSQIMEIPGMGEEGECQVWVEVTELSILPATDGGRSLEVQLELLAQAVVRCRRAVGLLRDLYSTAWEMETEVETLALPRLEDWSVRSQSVREVVETGNSVRQVVDCWVTAGETRAAQEGKQAVFSNEMRLTALYLDETGALQSVQRPVTASIRVDAPAGARCRARCLVDGDIHAAVTSGGIEVRFTAEFHSLVLGERRVTAVSSARMTEPRKRGEGDQPSLVLRLAAPGERLWDIAKTYGTTTEEILRANELEEEALPTGQMLLIPRVR